MRPGEFNAQAGRSWHRGGRVDLFFYEQVRTRYYLRFTQLVLILIVCLTVIPVAAIFALFLTKRHTDQNVNINVRVAPRENGEWGESDNRCGAGFTRAFDTAGEVNQQCIGCAINLTKVECLVCASGTSASQLVIRTKLIAVAVSTCCMCAFAAPR